MNRHATGVLADRAALNAILSRAVTLPDEARQAFLR